MADIARLTGMNVRTVYRDLKALEDELAVPIFQAGRGRYGIERKYLLPPLLLTVPEGIVLFLASRLIARWSDESDQAVISAFTKIASELPQPIARHVTATMLAVGEQDSNRPFTAIFNSVARGWAEGRVVEIIYDSGSGEPRQTRVRPYLLEPFAAGRSIYLIGHDEIAGAMRTYKIERIRQATLTLDRYEIPDEFDPDQFLANSWGIWSTDTTPPVDVRLRFDAGVARRVRETDLASLAGPDRAARRARRAGRPGCGDRRDPAVDPVVGRPGRGPRAARAARTWSRPLSGSGRPLRLRVAQREPEQEGERRPGRGSAGVTGIRSHASPATPDR